MSTYRISRLAAHAGIPTTTLRYYEKEGLVPAARTPGGYRLYTDADAERVRFIAAAKHLGLSLGRIRDLLGVWDGGMCRSLLADADADREELRGGGVTVRLPAVHAARLAELVVAEQECCPFLGFGLTFDGSHVALTVRAPEGVEPLVAALFDREPAATGEPRHRC